MPLLPLLLQEIFSAGLKASLRVRAFFLEDNDIQAIENICSFVHGKQIRGRRPSRRKEEQVVVKLGWGDWCARVTWWSQPDQRAMTGIFAFGYFGHIHHQLLPHLGNMSEKLLLPSREQTPMALVISKEQTELFPCVYSHTISALPVYNCLRNVLQAPASGETSLLWETFLRRLHRLLITGPALKPTGVHGRDAPFP